MNTGFYEVMRKELRNAVEEIRTELEHVCILVSVELLVIIKLFFHTHAIYSTALFSGVPIEFLSTIQAMEIKESTVPANGDCLISNGSDVLKAVSSIRQNYSTKLEQVLIYKPY